jgi:deoxyribodipyrimidine photolyase-related protein
MNTPDDLKSFFKPTKKSFFQTSFYKQQRKKFGVLLDEEFQPVGGKWTYDADNRKKYPKNKVPPAIHFPKKSSFWDAAIIYTEKHFQITQVLFRWIIVIQLTMQRLLHGSSSF